MKNKLESLKEELRQIIEDEEDERIYKIILQEKDMKEEY